MKKLLIFTGLVLVVICANAQTVNIHFKDGSVNQISSSTVDYIDFSEGENNEETGEFSIVTTNPIVDQKDYAINTTSSYNDETFGKTSIDACATLSSQLATANKKISELNLTDAQRAYLYKALENLVDCVIVPTYIELADNVEELDAVISGLTVSSITQEKINKACSCFLEAREKWEISEGFLMGAASDFEILWSIDSWPLNRTLLINYLSTGNMTDEMLEDATILGFHALEFILFRDGQPRDVAEFQSKDVYNGFENIDGSAELSYAQTICNLLKKRAFQLQVAWEGAGKNSNRTALVKAAGLDYTTESGLSFGDNLKYAGINSRSTFFSLQYAIAQILSDDEGSVSADANEVGTVKIAKPFSSGYVGYIESPYSYNSINDFRNNIRSIRNVWLGSLDRTANKYSFHTFFASIGDQATNHSIENAVVDAIEAISNLPYPFVKYCCSIWDKNFEDYDDEK